MKREFPVSTPEQLDYAMDLIRQSHDISQVTDRLGIMQPSLYFDETHQCDGT